VSLLHVLNPIVMWKLFKCKRY